MIWLTELQHQCVNSGLRRDQTCEPAARQLISNHPVALPPAHLTMYMFTNYSISCLLDLFILLEHMFTLSLDI